MSRHREGEGPTPDPSYSPLRPGKRDAGAARRLNFGGNQSQAASETYGESAAEREEDMQPLQRRQSQEGLSNQELTARFFALQSEVSRMSDTFQRRQKFPEERKQSLMSPNRQHQASTHASPTRAEREEDQEEAARESNRQEPANAPAAHEEAGVSGMRDAEALRSALETEKERANELEKQVQHERGRVERTEKRLREHYENRLEEARKEKQRLSERVEELEHQSTRHKVASGRQAELTQGELDSLRKEIQEQESLIQGYQAENEAAMHRLKKFQQEAKEREEKLQRENAQLRSELNGLKERQDTSSQKGEVGESLQRVLQLERQLEEVRDDAQSKQQELKEQLRKAKQEKKDLEAKISGVDLQALQEDVTTAQRAEERFQHERKEYQAKIDDLQRKVDWYAENQELIGERDEQLAERDRRIKELESRLSNEEGPDHGNVGTTKRLKEHVRKLSNENSELRTALEQKNPSSTAALLSAVRPKPEESEHVRSLENQVSKLKQDLQAKEEEREAAVRSLRQEHEKMKSRYETELRKAKASANAAGGNKSSRVKDLERQVEDVREFYTKKVKQLQTQLQEQQGAGKNDSQRRRTGRHNDKQPLGNNDEHFLEGGKEGEHHGQRQGHEPSAKTDAEVQAVQEQPESNGEGSNGRMTEKEEAAVQAKVAWSEETSREQHDRDDEEAKASQIARQKLQEAYVEAVERSASKVATLERQLEEANTRLEEKERESQRVGELERALNDSEERRHELEAEKGRLEELAGPGAARVKEVMADVDARLEEMRRTLPSDETSWMGTRERQWLWIAQHARRVGAQEAVAARKEAEKAVAAKNDELASFRQEVDAILAAALRQQQPLRQ